MMENEGENYRNLCLLTKVTDINIVPSTIQTTRQNQIIIGFMEQVRHWSVSINLLKPKAGHIWGKLNVTYEDNSVVSGIVAYKRLFDVTEEIPHLKSEDLILEKVNETTWRVELLKNMNVLTNTNVSEHDSESPNKIWFVDTKLVIDEDEIIKVATLIYDSQIPYGKTIQLQADAHIAGSYTWVGMIASYDDHKIPFVTVSADIGCGMSIIPFVKATVAITENKDHGDSKMIEENPFVTPCPAVALSCADSYDSEGKRNQLKSTDVPNIEDMKLAFMLKARASLFRGKKSEFGDDTNTIRLLNQALLFFGSQIDLSDYVNNLKYVFDTLEINYGKDPLIFASRFAQSLGSSGNHFLELAESSQDNSLFAVVHSGSRGLGALIYKKILTLSHIYIGGNIATEKLSLLYRRAFDVLCKFAQLNRILCGLSVLDSLGFSVDGTELKNVMINSQMFNNCSLNENQKIKLLFGLTHNGIKTFVNHDERKVIHIMSKGAVALSRKSDIGIVALRAGEGCDLFILNDNDAKWIEIENSVSLEGYEQVFDLDETDILFAGHGAGRNGSASSTSKKSSYPGMIAYYKRNNFIGNLSPNVIGDNPEIAYKSPEEIRKKLPLDESVYYTNLKSLVNHKEGIDYFRSEQFAQFCIQTYHEADEKLKFWYDIGVVRHVKETEEEIRTIFLEQQAQIDNFFRCYPCTPVV